ncbi:peptide/nickel transport system substrate-binding protein/oligopeptide transport system substrate-binding protein [Novosphingobium kunmingense]|uniref:Peptide/nickel transport system substrate-binding protein/oligopeptide transport system substrate-binding protein n=1 Tax=Novosphingobium kunmingense TaxID=1211806 RepID=A0A2N0H5P8_9SPHN|nr:ABC transporter substrate-binding protein [Novosphingobium kunmingense]PKB14265.1 peptide/nickel transport system substrate-binding protein/oligopeptide transport system substrate-binding protein [Novosphingobium kunmingense]
MMRSHPFILAIAAAGLALLGGCGKGSDDTVSVVVIGQTGAAFNTGARLPQAAQIVRSATAEGLVGFDEQGRAIPALADRWIVTDDGMSYIFRLRDGTWPDGSDITGETARTALLEAMGRAKAGPLAGDLASVAEVRAMAGRVVEIRLHQQMPDMLQVLAQPELGLLRGARGAGPMRLTRNKDVAILRAIPPEDRGLPAVAGWAARIRPVELRTMPAGTAIDRFNADEASIVLGGRFSDFPLLDAKGVPRGAVRLDPVNGLFGLAVLHDDGFLSKPENREALAMAVDREALIGALNVGGWTATTRIVNPGLAGDTGAIGERWMGRTIEDRRAMAAARVAKWKGAGSGPVVLRVAMPAGPGADVLFRRLSADFAAIGLATRRVGETAPADLRLVDVVARYAGASWFLNQLGCARRVGLCSLSADSLVAAALEEPDAALRADLYADAEAQLTIANGFIPFGVPIRWSLVAGKATGFAANPWNVHPLMPMAPRPR